MNGLVACDGGSARAIRNERGESGKSCQNRRAGEGLMMVEAERKTGCDADQGMTGTAHQSEPTASGSSRIRTGMSRRVSCQTPNAAQSGR